ncbi:MAG: acetyl-CoA hydrolase/transferase C-terminal domain-containing protein, partial [Bacteroidales bacterium]|nr:acetyl-CoA hydrolase/transferase C-terminal domain-containing protein [Bacteroidales bacterium]
CGTPRSQIHWIVTEFGAAEVFGKSLQERAKLLISIAHPSAREELEKAAFERYGEHFNYVLER